MSRRLRADEIGDAPWSMVRADLHVFLMRVFRGLAITLGTFGILRGVGYWPTIQPDRLPGGVSLLSSAIPLFAWALAWYIAGAGAFLGAALSKAYAGAGIAGMSLAWALGYTTSWLMSLDLDVTSPPDWIDVVCPLHLLTHLAVEVSGPNVRDYLSASVYWTICILCVGGRYLASASLELTGGTSPSAAP